jgi:hypothetical protein
MPATRMRRRRRAGLPRENPLFFYSRRVWEVADTHVRLVAFYLFLHRIRKKVERDPRPYSDPTLLPDVMPALPIRGKQKAASAA